MEDKFKKCLFCNTKTYLYLANRQYSGWTYYWIQCSCCGSRGPLATSKKEAIEAWNHREGEK